MTNTWKGSLAAMAAVMFVFQGGLSVAVAGDTAGPGQAPRVLKASLWPHKTELLPGENMDFNLVVKNVSGKDAQLTTGGKPPDWELRIVETNRYFQWVGEGAFESGPLSLKAGASLELKLSAGKAPGRWLISNGGDLPELPEGVYECFAVLKRPDMTVGEVQTNTNRVRILPKERKSATYATKRESGVVPDQADAFRRAREYAKSQGMNLSELRLVTQNNDAWVFRTEPNVKVAVFFTVSKTTGDVTMKHEEAADAPPPKGGKRR